MVVGIFVGDLVVFLLALIAFGHTIYRWWDAACLVLCISALVLWALSGDALIALGFAITADAIAFIPTLVKSYREPFSEPPYLWFLFSLTGLLAAGSATADFPSLAFPIYYFLANAVLGILILARRRAQ